MAATDSPLKVNKVTKERVRLAAAMLACTQGELVDRAVAEYIENNAADFDTRLDAAREALLGGDEAVARFLAQG